MEQSNMKDSPDSGRWERGQKASATWAAKGLTLEALEGH